ncbi:putative transcriptional regulator, TetR family protein [Emticicia aquatilis]|uniref:Transcriptional regulator, TetR family protein n=1 Tax=Emticicia aquatilis TaxID=1537369 RepID=A0A916YNB8_9BACT|nr:TetR/AcrR family transcriptional regulator [Emticicia aquatilis]GGD52904.1 putative transcriptional regulator, TetR family protein [Emticicia aquatilis]
MDTKKNIESTAARLFYEQGYNSTGINQIIAEAGIAKASLYAHFPSKVDILKKYLQNTSESSIEALRNVIEQKQTPKDKVLSVFDFLLGFSNETNFNGCQFLNIATEIPQSNEDVLSIIQGHKNRIRQLFVEILEPINKENLADELYILFEGALASSKVFKDKWTIETTLRIVEKII